MVGKTRPYISIYYPSTFRGRGRVYEIINFLRRWLVKTAPTGIIKTIARLGNASRERKSASVFATPDK